MTSAKGSNTKTVARRGRRPRGLNTSEINRSMTQQLNSSALHNDDLFQLFRNLDND